MLFYDGSLPVTPTQVFDAAFFAKGCETDVIVRNAKGEPVLNPDGTPKTVKGELRDLLVPMAGDRAKLLAQAAANQREFVEQGNEWVGALQRTAQEMERLRPMGMDGKNPKNLKEGFSFKDNGGSLHVSAETANALFALRDNEGNRFLFKFFSGVNSDELTNYIKNHLDDAATGYNKFPGFTSEITIDKMADKQAWATYDNAFKSAVDSATQKVQLDQTTFQGLVSRQNNAIETMADLQSKFASTFEKLVGNLRPAQ